MMMMTMMMMAANIYTGFTLSGTVLNMLHCIISEYLK